MRSDRSLRKLYAHYNKKYFDGLLPKNTLVRFGNLDNGTMGELGHADDDPNGRPEIVVHAALKRFGCAIRGTLFHECVHLKLDRNHPKHSHGTLFDKEMNKLARKKAFNWFDGEMIW